MSRQHRRRDKASKKKNGGVNNRAAATAADDEWDDDLDEELWNAVLGCIGLPFLCCGQVWQVCGWKNLLFVGLLVLFWAPLFYLTFQWEPTVPPGSPAYDHALHNRLVHQRHYCILGALVTLAVGLYVNVADECHGQCTADVRQSLCYLWWWSGTSTTKQQRSQRPPPDPRDIVIPLSNHRHDHATADQENLLLEQDDNDDNETGALISQQHAGNRKLDRLIYKHSNAYHQVAGKQRQAIVRRILRTIKSNESGFIQWDHVQQDWVDVPDHVATRYIVTLLEGERPRRVTFAAFTNNDNTVNRTNEHETPASSSVLTAQKKTPAKQSKTTRRPAPRSNANNNNNPKESIQMTTLTTTNTSAAAKSQVENGEENCDSPNR